MEAGNGQKGRGERGGEGRGSEAYATNNLILCCIQKGATGKRMNERGGETTTEMPLYGLFDGKVDVKL